MLRHRTRAGGPDVYELIVDGVFAMDTVQVSSELRLASETLRRLAGSGWRVLLGGLGLGYTLRELLADQRVAAVEVVELEPELVTWLRDGLRTPSRWTLSCSMSTTARISLCTNRTRRCTPSPHWPPPYAPFVLAAGSRSGRRRPPLSSSPACALSPGRSRS